MPHKTCSWGNCKHRSNKDETKEQNITFRKFPQPKTQRERCLQWIQMCNRWHTDLNLERVGHFHYVCSKHFEDGSDVPMCAPGNPEPRRRQSSTINQQNQRAKPINPYVNETIQKNSVCIINKYCDDTTKSNMMSVKQKVYDYLKKKKSLRDPFLSEDVKPYLSEHHVYTCDFCAASYSYLQELESHLTYHIKRNMYIIKDECMETNDDSSNKICITTGNKEDNFNKRPVWGIWGTLLSKGNSIQGSLENRHNGSGFETSSIATVKEECIEANYTYTKMCETKVNKNDTESQPINQYISETRHQYLVPNTSQPSDTVSCVRESTGMAHSCESPFQSGACDSSKVKKHFTFQNEMQTFICVVCSVILTEVSHLVTHLRSHFGEIQYNDIIANSSKLLESLTKHYRLHRDEQTYMCEVCSTTFIRPLALAKHLWSEHPRHHDENKYLCEVCAATFNFLSALKKHLRVHSGEKPYMCKFCSGTFTTKSYLEIHSRRVHSGDKPYICEDCPARFAVKDSLKNHSRVHSGETKTRPSERPHMCEICLKTLADKKSLKNHLRIHSGDKPYKCKICPARFSSSHGLFAHNKIHSGNKHYMCEVCPARFYTSGKLKRHSRVHSGEKPYVCEVCSATFTQKGSLKMHSRIHSGDKPYVCEVCSVAFTQLGTLKSHVRTHVRDKPLC